MKKFLAVCLSIITIISCGTVALAVDDGTETRTFVTDSATITIEDSGDLYIVTATYPDHTEIATRDMVTNLVTTKYLDNQGNIIKTLTMSAEISVTPVPASSYQHTFSNYEYDIDDSGTHDVWTCRREDDYKTRTYIDNTTTAARLDHWKTWVETINDLELKLIKKAGIALATTAISGAITGGLATGLTFLKGTLSAEMILMDLCEAWDDADVVFDSL